MRKRRTRKKENNSVTGDEDIETCGVEWALCVEF
jgi:hypothetical protein